MKKIKIKIAERERERKKEKSEKKCEISIFLNKIVRYIENLEILCKNCKQF